VASVFKAKGAAKYSIVYTNENGKRCKKMGATDKAVSERIARDIENKVALRNQGLIDPKAEAYRDHDALPIAAHLEAFQRFLASKGGSKRHPEVTCSRTRKTLALARVKRISELSLSKAQQAIQSLRDEGLSTEPLTIASVPSRGLPDGYGRMVAHVSITWPTWQPQALSRIDAGYSAILLLGKHPGSSRLRRLVPKLVV
jgi:hypothetical protein